jgi:hypothetical protein
MDAALVGQFGCGNPVVAGGEVIGVGCRLAAGVGGAQRDDSGREQEERAGQQSATSRNWTGHNSSSVSLPRRVARNDAG